MHYEPSLCPLFLLVFRCGRSLSRRVDRAGGGRLVDGVRAAERNGEPPSRRARGERAAHGALVALHRCAAVGLHRFAPAAPGRRGDVGLALGVGAGGLCVRRLLPVQRLFAHRFALRPTLHDPRAGGFGRGGVALAGRAALGAGLGRDGGDDDGHRGVDSRPRCAR